MSDKCGIRLEDDVKVYGVCQKQIGHDGPHQDIAASWANTPSSATPFGCLGCGEKFQDFESMRKHECGSATPGGASPGTPQDVWPDYCLKCNTRHTSATCPAPAVEGEKGAISDDLVAEAIGIIGMGLIRGEKIKAVLELGLAAGRRQEREKNCRAVCDLCANSSPRFIAEPRYIKEKEVWVHDHRSVEGYYECRADAIRRDNPLTAAQKEKRNDA
jgi:hypothetical protein